MDMSVSSGARAAIRQVLFVEDDVDIRRTYAGALRRARFVVDEVGCIADAVGFLGRRRAHAVVMDRNLPDGDGLEVVPILQIMHPDNVVVAFTADTEWRARRDAKRCGCHAFVTK